MTHALYLLGLKNNWDFRMYASHDAPADHQSKYIPASQYKAFRKNKLAFAMAALKTGCSADLIIFSHVNLSLMACLIKLINPQCRIWLIVHGVEVWRPLKWWKKWIWKIADRLVCVSRFSRDEVIRRHAADPDHCVVLNNALDSFLKLPENFHKPAYLQARYQLTPTAKVILTLSRISSTEKFKGYDQVLKALQGIKERVEIKYLLAGPSEERERKRLEHLIQQYGLGSNVILTGFISDEELADHFLLADLFVMPSKKEGFGIVFIEALSFGLPVICGNADGSVDAVRSADMGTAIDPDSCEQLEKALLQQLSTALTNDQRMGIQQQCFQQFSAQHYQNTIEKMIKDENGN